MDREIIPIIGERENENENELIGIRTEGRTWSNTLVDFTCSAIVIFIFVVVILALFGLF